MRDHSNQLPIDFSQSPERRRFRFDSLNWLEFTFFALSNLGRKEKLQKCHVVWSDFLVDWLKIFDLMAMVTIVFLIIPTQFLVPNDNTKGMFYFDILTLLLFCSIVWVGFVYSLQEFKELIRIKILPRLEKNNSVISINILDFYLNKIKIEIKGYSFHLFFFSIILNVFFVGIYLIIAAAIIQVLPLNTIWPNIFSITLVVFLFYIVFYILIASLISLIVLLLFLVKCHPDINPYIEMGGFEKYGKFVINSLSLIIVALAAIPLLQLVVQNISKFTPEKIDQSINFTKFSNLSIQNFTSSIQGLITVNIGEIPISSFVNYWVYALIFLIFFALSLSILISIYVCIKKRKDDELTKLEDAIEEINFEYLYDRQSWERKIYFLYLIERVSNLQEWPVRKIYIAQILLSILTSYVFFIDLKF
jgi:hypothetical protein